MIDAELKRAKRAVRLGQATPETYYDVIQRQAKWRGRCGTGKRAGRCNKPRRRRPRARRRRMLDPTAIYKVPVTGRSPWAGARQPLVTLVMYVDTQCPYCKYGACVVRQLRKQFPRDLKVVYRAHPLKFHPLTPGRKPPSRRTVLGAPGLSPGG